MQKHLPLSNFLTINSNLIPMVNFLPNYISPLWTFHTLIVIYQLLPCIEEFIFNNSYATLGFPVCIQTFYNVTIIWIINYLTKGLLKNCLILSFKTFFSEDSNTLLKSCIQMTYDGTDNTSRKATIQLKVSILPLFLGGRWCVHHKYAADAGWNVMPEY